MDRNAIGAVLLVKAEIIAADPVVFPAARINSLDYVFTVVALAHAG